MTDSLMDAVASDSTTLYSLGWNGLGAVADLHSAEWRALFAHLDQEQRAFLARDHEFRPAEYIWPRDALHSWSRVWEYPYVYRHLQQCVRLNANRPLRVMDVGSGVTFFPFALARAGADVRCIDVDPVCVEGIQNAARVLETGSRVIEAALSEAEAIPAPANSVDAVYSISVLEHTPDPRRVIQDIVRVLRPGGHLVLTIDIDLRGDAAIGPAAYHNMRSYLDATLDACHSYRTLHPLELLTSQSSPYAPPQPRGARAVVNTAKQLIKPLLGRQRIATPPYVLAVEGLCYRKPLSS